jgi:L,D-transpeptidase ErfK/SrfK
MNIYSIARAVRAFCLAFTIFTTPAYATTYVMPEPGSALLGTVGYKESEPGDTLLAIAQKNDLGVNAIEGANRGIPAQAMLRNGTHVQIPSSYLLPPIQRTGIVINLPEMRMYYYVNDKSVKTYPIGIGRVGKTIPLTRTIVMRKVKNPVWIPPEDIRAFNEQQGVVLPRIMPAGPDNPLGPYAIYLNLPTYLIHSTIFPDSIGTRASFGCIRMHESDILDFYPIIEAGTEVTIVDMPTKVGWQGKTLLLEAHAPLEERSSEYSASYPGMVNSINYAISSHPTFVDWQLVEDLSQIRDGLPHDIGFRL